jgi:hypothetical protein
VNLYLLVEGSKTEPQIYEAWIGYVFPCLRRVKDRDEIKHNHCYIFEGSGYNYTKTRVQAALEDAVAVGCVDHLILCFDSDYRTFEETFSEIEAELLAAQDIMQSVSDQFPPISIIIQNRCIETWLLGNTKVVRSSDENLREHVDFYNVAVDDPELMLHRVESRQRAVARYHKEYLKAVFRAAGESYSESSPGIAMNSDYLEALIARHVETGHLLFFRRLLDLWQHLGSPLFADRPLPPPS